jgi:hypothetical protein
MPGREHAASSETHIFKTVASVKGTAGSLKIILQQMLHVSGKSSTFFTEPELS